jgi:hypothetical protein
MDQEWQGPSRTGEEERRLVNGMFVSFCLPHMRVGANLEHLLKPSSTPPTRCSGRSERQRGWNSLRVPLRRVPRAHGEHASGALALATDTSKTYLLS